jgi:predicted nucleic acid-binding protein
LSALLDTSVVLNPAGATHPEIDETWAISVITVGELEAGVLVAEDVRTRASRLRRLTQILGDAPILGVDRGVAARYGELRAATGRVPSNDLWIAATALAHELTLITADERQAKLPLVRATLVA